MAFGDAGTEIQKLEKQIEFRDCQIKKLNYNYTMLQIEFQKHIEEPTDSQSNKKLKNKAIDQLINDDHQIKTAKFEINNNCNIENISVNIKEENNDEQMLVYKKEKILREPTKDSIENFDEYAEIIIKSDSKNLQRKIPTINYKAIESSAVMLSSLYQEIVRLNQVK